ncbi:tsn1 [Candida pseudojiufengensis]|uniref:tsn1 n=1 Tax=Candida pseudojiufengensis TaxID=497109 RepID=UPI0022247181|nr:tsn1 [Candida pseudojiufengensis]KAI5960935.1 tsn1 [Candida pseudojiufengensis]
MSQTFQLDRFFEDIRSEIAKDINKKALIQDLENEFDLSIIPYQSKINSWISVSPNQLNLEFKNTNSFENDIQVNLSHYLQKLSDLDCKASQKEKLTNKFIEDSIYILLANRYFWILSFSFINDPIKLKLVTINEELGIVETPKEIFTALKLDNINYQIYLISLLKFIDVIVNYTTTTVINQSIGSSNEKSSNYTLGVINSQIVSKIQNGFSLLDLKNDILRKRFDSLKYNSQRLNKIVYDLSLRNLITTFGEVE